MLGVNYLSQDLSLEFSCCSAVKGHAETDQLQRGGLCKAEYKMKHGIEVVDWNSEELNLNLYHEFLL